jgi:hypothetical protein
VGIGVCSDGDRLYRVRMQISPALAAIATAFACASCSGPSGSSSERERAKAAQSAIADDLESTGDTPADLEQALVRTAKKSASGWILVGSTIHGELEEGARSDHLVVLRGAYCYRIFAAGGTHVADLDLLLFDPNGVQIQQDPAQDRFPTLGMQTEICPASGGAYRLQAVMYKGSGAFAARVYQTPS